MWSAAVRWDTIQYSVHMFNCMVYKMSALVAVKHTGEQLQECSIAMFSNTRPGQ
jgi:hypothetical protein